MSDVVNEVKQEVQKVVEEVKEYFVYEKAHLQKFLDYLAKRPYAEVVEIIEVMKQAKVFNPAPPAAPTPVAPEAPATVVITQAPEVDPSAPAVDSAPVADGSQASS